MSFLGINMPAPFDKPFDVAQDELKAVLCLGVAPSREYQALVRNGLSYLTEHADDEASADGFDIYHVEEVLI